MVREIKKPSKLLFLTITFIMLLSLFLWGCGQKKTETGGQEAKQGNEKFPEKDITMIVPWNPGSTSDRNARTMKPYFDKVVGRPLLIENIPGGSGLAGWTAYMNKPTDGYTFVFTNWPVLYQQIVMGEAKYKLDNFYNLGGINDDPILFLKRKDDNRWKNFAEFIEDCKKNPNKYKVSMTGPNSFQNLVAYYVMDVFGIKFQIVNSPGGANEANQLLAGGHADLCLTNSYSGYLIRDVAYALGLMANTKVPNMWPEATPISEQTGKSDLAELTVLRAFSINSEVQEKHPERVKFIEEALAKACTDPEFVKQLKDNGEADVSFWIPREQFEKKLKGSLEIVDKYKQFLVKK
ncbi:tripartite tricarboxylate transporter substrate-binding protein [Neomoorella mulderi]|uniref:Tripartite tricarboxylate transporter family receptor n=1 Tax=Moorella mulderi DSM 14980 TaxID=1122241 RepID=A0A151AW26_9FIRM|nr:tripartite tricarboxylate transporter substrate-binding protein [Moorella mulderi]KYH31763.1 tripartite tricarboxylate transporter family receptor [Moorella mulderi DSM 14980]